MSEEIEFDFKKVNDFFIKHYNYFVIGIIMFIGLLYKIELLDFPRDYWHDEAFQYLYAEKPISFILSSMDVHPPLFNLLSKGILLINDSFLCTRYFMVFLSLIMLITTYFYVSKVFGKFQAFVTCAILSTFPTWVFYATEFRSYMFVLMLIPIQMYLFYRFITKLDKKYLYGCMILSVVLLYSHYFTALMILGQAIFILIRKRAILFRVLSTSILSLFLCVPLIIYFLNTLPKIEAFWFKEITLKSVISTFSYLIFPNPTGLTTVLTIIFYVTFIVLFVKVFWKKTIEDKHWLLIYQGFLPIAILYFVSQFNPIYHHRYFLFGGISIMILFSVCVIEFIKSLKSNNQQSLFMLYILLLVFAIGTLQSSDDYNFELRDSSQFLKNVIETDYFENDYVIVHTSTFSQSPYKVYFKDNHNVKNLLLTNLTEKQLFTAGGSVIEKEEVIRTKDLLQSYNATFYFVSDKLLAEKVVFEKGGLYITRDKNYAEDWNEKWQE